VFNKKSLYMFTIATLLVTIASGAFGQNPQTQTAPIYSVNAKYVNGTAPGYAPTAGTGLALNLGSGTVNCNGSLHTYTGGTISLTASTTNYVYLNVSASCAPAVKTSSFAPSDIPLAVVVAGPSTITSITDDRAALTTGSGAGCVTSSTNFFLLANAGPCLNAELQQGNDLGIYTVGQSDNGAGTITAAGLYSSAILSSGVPTYNVLAYGADRTGTTDAGPAIRAALTACQNNGVAGFYGVVYVPFGRYYINTTVSDVIIGGPGNQVALPIGSCMLVGDHFRSQTSIYYQGGGSIYAVAEVASTSIPWNAAFGGIKDIYFSGGNLATRCISFLSPVDAGFVFRDVGVQNCTTYDIDVASGWLNFHGENIRVDGVGNGGYFWHLVATEGLFLGNFSVNGGTIATFNTNAPTAQGAGLILFDATNAGPQVGTMEWSNERWEIDGSRGIAANGALITVTASNTTASKGGVFVLRDINMQNSSWQGTVPITAYSFSGGILTLTAANSFIAGATTTIEAPATDPLFPLNNLQVVVLASGLSSSQFEITTSAVTGSGSSVGTFGYPTWFATFSQAAGSAAGFTFNLENFVYEGLSGFDCPTAVCGAGWGATTTTYFPSGAGTATLSGHFGGSTVSNVHTLTSMQGNTLTDVQQQVLGPADTFPRLQLLANGSFAAGSGSAAPTGAVYFPSGQTGIMTSANLVNDSAFIGGFKSTNANAYWGTNGTITLTATGPQGDGACTYTGIGASAANNGCYSGPYTFPANTILSFSAWLNATNLVSGQQFLYLCTSTNCSTILQSTYATPGVNRQVSATVNIGSNTTVYVMMQISGSYNVTNGQTITWSEPQLNVVPTTSTPPNLYSVSWLGSIASPSNPPVLTINSVTCLLTGSCTVPAAPVACSSTITDSAAVTLNTASAGDTCVGASSPWTLVHTTATRSLSLSNLVSGSTVEIRYLQDATGGALMTAGSCNGTTTVWNLSTPGGGFATQSASFTIPIQVGANAGSSPANSAGSGGWLTVKFDGTYCNLVVN
jgi:hypothetical protein